MESFLSLFFALLYSLLLLRTAMAGDTITPTLPLLDGQTLVSPGSSFELGFFRPGSSQKRYLGIWYKKRSIGTVVWVANRVSPLTDNHGVLKIGNDGKLSLHNKTDTTIWSSNTSKVQAQIRNPVARLLDSGNLVVIDLNDDDDPSNYLWQSFDYPCDIMLPGMKLGWNLKTGFQRFLSSWKTTSDPSPGDYTYGIDIQGFPQLELRKGEDVLYRAGSWNGIRLSGTPHLNPNPIFQYDFIRNQEEAYFTFVCQSHSVDSELVLNQSGLVNRFIWNDRSHDWVVYKTVPSDQCDVYDSCGSHGLCNLDNSPVCQCLDRFVPKSPEKWNSSNWSDGCIRRTTLDCGKGEGFRKYKGLKLPDTKNSVVDMAMGLEECEEECLKNCSCTAYAVADIKQDNGCLLWIGELIDIRALPDKGQDLYVKMAASDLDEGKGNSNKKRDLILICVPLFLGMLLFLGFMVYIKRGKCNIDEDSKDELELPVLGFVTITDATNNFSSDNKLGQGGFGPVYKGMLPDGQEIAVKRLSKNSSQGLNEFKNEVILISKLQHRNLVKLLGCCIQGEEKMLIYEYMPNKSLDSFIFDQTRRTALDWGKRYEIICGIARGLLYLHQDSRLRIVHRDLKASNILLDNEMNPKISDFGLARTFGGDQSNEDNTGQVVGTYGYMSPEYATHGHFSVKSDIFSFGVVILEIVSGKKNRGFCHPEHHHNLLGHAWRLWKEGNPLKLMDATIEKPLNLSEVLRCIQVGLLCVQQCPDDRPTMPSVVLMLWSTETLPQPECPGFFSDLTQEEKSRSLSREREPGNTNEVTITVLEGR